MPKIRSAPEDRRGDHPAVRDIIGQIKDRHALLRPAEQAVADAILADVRGAVEASNAEIAARAGVSQPTVTRFCRAIGCEGVRDFKLQLARSLVVGDLYLDEPPPAPAEGNRPAYFDSVFREAHTAIDEVERQIDPGALIKAAGWIERARRVVVFGLGGSSAALAEEMHVRLFRYGIGVNALTDPYMARMTAATLGPNDVLIAISASGRTREVVEAVDLARHYRAHTIAITTPAGDLATAAELTLGARIPEYPDTLKPSAFRFGFLAVIDLLSAAVGYRLSADAREKLRRIRYTVLARRNEAAMEPLGD